MKEFDFDNLENEVGVVSLKEKIIDGLKWHTFDIKKIHLETEDENGVHFEFCFEENEA